MSFTVSIFLLIFVIHVVLFIRKAGNKVLEEISSIIFHAGLFAMSIMLGFAIPFYAQNGIFIFGLSQDTLNMALIIVGFGILMLTYAQIVKYSNELGKSS